MILLFFHQPTVHRHGDHLPRDELPALLGLRRFHGGRGLPLNIPGLAARAAAGQGHALFPHFPLLIFHDGLLVIGRHGALGFCRRKRQLRSVEIGRSASARTI